MSTTDDLKTYYSSLLIMQYNQKPKAIGTIQALSGAAIASDLEGQMKEAFDLDTAIGKQLDILGNLVGVSRVLPVALPAPDYFSTVDSDAPSTALKGFSTSDIPVVQPYWFFYGAYPTESLWSMDDDTYRKLIKYIIQLNKSDFGLYDIARILLTVPRNPTTFFGLGDTGQAVAITGVGTITPTVMQVVFYIYQNGVPDLLFKAILAAKALPVPAGVKVLLYVDSVLTAY
jgi:hypothetical protein